MTVPAPDLTTMSSTELLGLYSKILTELNSREVIWSRNAPAGDYAELLVAEALGGRIAKASEKSWDVRIGDHLVQVKCRVTNATSKKSQTFSPFRSFNFDTCVFVILDSVTYKVVRAVEVARELVETSAARSEWVAGSRVTVKAVMALTDVRDLTAELCAAQSEVDTHGRTAEHDS